MGNYYYILMGNAKMLKYFRYSVLKFKGVKLLAKGWGVFTN